jgi:hypothetical protein
MDSKTNTEEEIQEITSDNEPENQRRAPVETESENDGICIEKNSTSMETERELYGKKKNTKQKGIKQFLNEGISETTRRCGFICGYAERVPQVRVYQVWPGKNVSIIIGFLHSHRTVPVLFLFFSGN